MIMYRFLSLMSLTLLLQTHEVSPGWFSSSSGDDEMQDSPVVLWWTPFTGQTGDWRTCGEDTCYFTENRTFLNDARTQVVMFYGSSFSSLDLPLPRSSAKQNWALLHEESPKNNPSFCYSDLIGLFNYTATWSRRSNFPLTLLSLPSLNDMTDLKYFVPTAEKNRLIQREGLSPVVYVQSSCDAPSDRDSYVTELMKFIRIDAYGKCLNNKQLPAHLTNPADTMNDDAFLQLMAKYKFTLAFENAIGEDYITEKLWRPLKLGSVPIYLGSPSAKDWAPNNNSVLSVWDFESPETLASLLIKLNSDDVAYGHLIEHKTVGRVDNTNLVEAMKKRTWNSGQGTDDMEQENFVEAFECFLCSEANRKRLNEQHGYSTRPVGPVDTSHFECPEPIHPVSRQPNRNNWWFHHWNKARIEARVIRQFSFDNRNYTADEFHQAVANLIQKRS